MTQSGPQENEAAAAVTLDMVDCKMHARITRSTCIKRQAGLIAQNIHLSGGIPLECRDCDQGRKNKAGEGGELVTVQTGIPAAPPPVVRHEGIVPVTPQGETNERTAIMGYSTRIVATCVNCERPDMKCNNSKDYGMLCGSCRTAIKNVPKEGHAAALAKAKARLCGRPKLTGGRKATATAPAPLPPVKYAMTEAKPGVGFAADDSIVISIVFSPKDKGLYEKFAEIAEGQCRNPDQQALWMIKQAVVEDAILQKEFGADIDGIPRALLQGN